MFLFLSKVFSRKSQLKAIKLDHLAVNLLGFSSTLTTREMKAKVNRCLSRLVEFDVLSKAEVFKTSPGNYFVRLERGAYFEMRTVRTYQPAPTDSPLFETLLTIGFEHAAAARLLRRYPQRLLAEWADITQAALERFGPGFFHKSPMAYLVDSVSKAAIGKRTAPDWWSDLKRAENREHHLSEEGLALFSRLRAELFSSDQSAAQGSRPSPASTGPTKIASILSSR